jgi:class 3 adenylate cyclase
VIAACVGGFLAARTARRRRARPSLERAVAEMGKQVTPLIMSSIEAVTSSSISALATWAESHRGEIGRRGGRTSEMTLMFSDIENSTAMNHELGDKQWLKLLRAHDSVVKKRVEARGGEVVKTQGDGFMVTFPEADDAVRCAMDMQQEFARGKGRFRKTPIRVRIGLHAGDAITKDGDVFGTNVALAAGRSSCPTPCGKGRRITMASRRSGSADPGRCR